MNKKLEEYLKIYASKVLKSQGYTWQLVIISTLKCFNPVFIYIFD